MPKSKIVRTLLLPLAALGWNQLIYYGANRLTQNKLHYDWTSSLDRLLPFLPWTVSIYFGCYIFWTINYLLSARQERQLAYRFFLADFLAKAICFACFVLLPTTNIRPPVADNSLWNNLLNFLYQIDVPSNLFPSIHCLVSWLCWIAVRRRKDIARWYKWFSLLMALSVCISTLTIRQHVIADVIGGIVLAEFSYRIVAFKQYICKR